MVDRGNSIAIEIHDSLGQNLFDHSLHRPMHRPMHRHDFRQSIDRLFSQKSTRVHSETRTHNLRGLHHPHLSEWLTTAPLKNPVPFEINRPTTYLSPSNSRLLQSDTASLASRGSSNVYNQNQKFSTNTLHINFLKDGLCTCHRPSPEGGPRARAGKYERNTRRLHCFYTLGGGENSLVCLKT
jgi:hypothetical protein